jgi:predicted DNA-binding protein
MALRDNYIHYHLSNYYRYGTYLKGVHQDDKEEGQTALAYRLKSQAEKHINDLTAEMKNKINDKEEDAVIKEIEKRLDYFFGLRKPTKGKEKKEYQFYQNISKELAEKASSVGKIYDRATGAVKGAGEVMFTPSVELEKRLKNLAKQADNERANINKSYIEASIDTVNKLVKEYNKQLSKGKLTKAELIGSDARLDELITQLISEKNKLVNVVNNIDKTSNKKRLSRGKDINTRSYFETIAEIRSLINAGLTSSATTTQGKVLEYVLEYTYGRGIAEAILGLDKTLQTEGSGKESKINVHESLAEDFGFPNSIACDTFEFNQYYSGTKKVDSLLTFKMPDESVEGGEREATAPISAKNYNLNNNELGLVHDTNLVNILLDSLNRKEEFYYHYLNIAAARPDKRSSYHGITESKKTVDYAMYLSLAYKAMAGSFKDSQAKYFVINNVASAEKATKYKIININRFFTEKVMKNSKSIEDLNKIFKYKFGDKSNEISLQEYNVWMGGKKKNMTQADIRIAGLLNAMARTHVNIALRTSALKL